MPVEVQGTRPLTVEAEDVVSGAVVEARCVYYAIPNREPVKFQLKPVRAFAVVIPRRILHFATRIRSWQKVRMASLWPSRVLRQGEL